MIAAPRSLFTGCISPVIRLDEATPVLSNGGVGI